MIASERSKRLRFSEIFRLPSYLLFLLSLTSIAFSMQRGGEALGFWVFVYGPLGVVFGFSANWPWLGNLALFAAWVSLAKRANVATMMFCSFALVSALRVYLVPEIYFDYKYGGNSKIDHFGPGYWLWLASIACASIAAIIRLNAPKPGFHEEDL